MCTSFLVSHCILRKNSNAALDHQADKNCGSVTFWYRSGSADPCLWPIQWIQIRLQFLIFDSLSFFLHHFSKTKSHRKKSQNNKEQGFSYYFCLMIEGSGSVPLTNGSVSRRPKNIQIRIDKTWSKINNFAVRYFVKSSKTLGLCFAKYSASPFL